MVTIHPITGSQKICSQCVTAKSSDEYFKNCKARDGLNAACKDCVRQWRKDNVESRRAQSHAAYYNNHEHNKTRSREYMREHSAEMNGKRLAKKLNILSRYSDPLRCACCGEETPEFLTLDHVENNGSEHRREIGMKSGWQFYLWIIRNNYPHGFQVLCMNCNCAKAWWGECPHQKGTRR